eukprot:Gb_05683 [translate_table: standard]
MPFASNRLCIGMPKEEARIFAAAVTISTANWSSLSNVKFPISFSLPSKKCCKASKKILALSTSLQMS